MQFFTERFKQNFGRFIDATIKESKKDQYKKALKAIELKGFFTHSEFIEQMKKYNYTLGMQMLLKHLKEEKILQHKNKFYFVDKLDELNAYNEKLSKFFLEHNIVISV